MLVRPDHLLKLIEGMEARISKGFRVCPETAPLMVEALRLYARTTRHRTRQFPR